MNFKNLEYVRLNWIESEYGRRNRNFLEYIRINSKKREREYVHLDENEFVMGARQPSYVELLLQATSFDFIISSSKDLCRRL
jgi:hypothetical protein